MKKLLLTSAIIMVAGVANAAINPYVSLKGGYSDKSLTIGYDPSLGLPDATERGLTGFTGAAAFGGAYAVHPVVTLRGELEYSYSQTEGTIGTLDWTFKQNTFSLNAYADFGDASWVVKPYVGLGAGFGTGNFGTKFGYLNLDDAFAYSIMAGVAYAIDSNWAIDLGAKYSSWLTSTPISDVGPLDLTLSGWTFLLGARYSF